MAFQERLARSQYPDLGSFLDVLPSEVDRIYAALAERGTELTASQPPPSPGEELGSPASQDRYRRLGELRMQAEATFRERLGEQLYASWKEYEDTEGARSEAKSVALALRHAGRPLTPTQERELARLIHRERASIEATVAAEVAGLSAMPPNQQLRAAGFHRLEATIKSDERIATSAAAFLSPEQARQMSDVWERQRQGWRRMMESALVR